MKTDGLRDYLHEHLATFAVPRYMQSFAIPLPRTASGLILKRQLRDEPIDAMAKSADVGETSA